MHCLCKNGLALCHKLSLSSSSSKHYLDAAERPAGLGAVPLKRQPWVRFLKRILKTRTETLARGHRDVAVLVAVVALRAHAGGRALGRDVAELAAVEALGAAAALGRALRRLVHRLRAFAGQVSSAPASHERQIQMARICMHVRNSNLANMLLGAM